MNTARTEITISRGRYVTPQLQLFRCTTVAGLPLGSEAMDFPESALIVKTSTLCSVSMGYICKGWSAIKMSTGMPRASAIETARSMSSGKGVTQRVGERDETVLQSERFP